MSMISNFVGVLVLAKDGTEKNVEFDFGNEEIVTIAANDDYFNKTNTSAEYIQKLLELPFVFGGHAMTLMKLIRMEKLYYDLELLERYISSKEISCIIVYTDNQMDKYRELVWLRHVTDANHFSSGTERMKHVVNNNNLELVPSKSSVLSDIKESAFNQDSAVQVVGTRVFLCNNTAGIKLEKKLKTTKAVVIRNSEILLNLPVSDTIQVDAGNLTINVDILQLRQEITIVWETMLQTGGLYDCNDWNRKRNLYYDKHKGALEKKVEDYWKNGIQIPYEEDPGECCALLGVRQFALDDSILRWAQAVDEIMDGIASLQNVPRKKDGTLKRNKYFHLGNRGYILFPRKTISAQGHCTSDRDIKFMLLF